MKKNKTSADDKPRIGNEPIRMCVICRTRFPKRELDRYVCPGESATDGLIPDPGRNKPGRGFYVCGEPACRDKFGKAMQGLMKKCKGVRT